MKLLFGFIALVISVTGMSLFQQPPRAENQTVKIGVLAKRGTEMCLAKWSPTAEYLTNKIQGHSFSVVPLDFDEIHPAVEKGEVDFVLANSSFYVALEYLFGASRIATLENLTSGKGHTVFGGVVFCRADRKDMRHLKDLKGKTFMAVKETSFGGWQMGWRELKEHGIDPHEDFTSLSYGGTHDAVVYAVRDGQVDAGTVRTDALERMANENRIHVEDFHVFSHALAPQLACEFPFVHSTILYPEWPFAKIRHTSDALAKRVTVALLEMSSDDPAAGAAKCVGWTIPLNYQPVHDCLKELQVGPYEDYGKITAEKVVREYWFWIAGIIGVLSIVIMILAYVHKLNRRLGESLTIMQNEIADRKQAKSQLQIERNKLTAIFESMVDGVYIANKDYDIQYINPVLKKQFGSLEGKKCHKYLHGLDEPCTFCKNEEVFAGKTVRWEWTSSENGMTYDLIDTPLKNPDGSISKLEIFRDITERKQAEEASAADAIRRRILMEQSRDGIVVLDEDGNVYESNQRFAEMLGFSPEEVSHLHVWDWEIQFAPEQLRDMLRNVDKTGDNFETQHRRKDGTIFDVEISTNGAVFAGEKLIFCVCRDITERKQAEEAKAAMQAQLLQSEKLASVGQLSAGVAHEINNPIGFISSNLGTMKKYLTKIRSYMESYGSQDQDEQTKITEIVIDFGDAISESIEGAGRVKKIVADLKGFARADSGKMEEADLNVELESTLNVVWNQIKYNCQVEKDYGELPNVQCYKGQINQVMLNLLVNAGQAIGDGSGIIRIRTWADDARCYISIKDNGCGISEEKISKIFDPFFTTKDVGKGTGLGLSVSHDIIKSHAGKIDVKSVVGQGTEFIISLPIEQSMVSVLPAQAEVVGA